MTVMSSTTRTALLAKKERLEALLEDALDAYEAALSEGQTKSYKFDDGEGMQAAVKRSLLELHETIDFLEARINFIDRRLNRGLIGNLNVRRKQGSAMGRRHY